MNSRVFLDLFRMDVAMSTNEVTLNTVQDFLGAMGTRNLDAIVELFSLSRWTGRLLKDSLAVYRALARYICFIKF